MRLTKLLCVLTVLMAWSPQAQAVTLTFDDIPQGRDLRYYEGEHNVGFSFEFAVIEHTGSTWGPPHSGSNVLGLTHAPQLGYSFMGFKTFNNPSDSQPLYSHTIAGYFSTEPGVVLEMIGQAGWNPLVSTVIGAPGQSWNNVYVEMSHEQGMNFVVFRPITTNALLHFCADDIRVDLVPEPGSLLVLGSGVSGLLFFVRRRTS